MQSLDTDGKAFNPLWLSSYRGGLFPKVGQLQAARPKRTSALSHHSPHF